MIQMGTASPILLPMLVLVIWTLIMLGWMAIARLPAMSAAKMDPQEGARTAELGAKLPPHIQWKADNYNHLLEQPTIFYVVCLVLAVAGFGEGLNLMLAWIYVGSRIVHSVIQATVNKVPLRFGVFLIGTAALLLMAGNGVIQLTG
jgi:hypothetical protein